MKNGITLPPASAGKSFTITNLSDEPLEVYPSDREAFILGTKKTVKIKPKRAKRKTWKGKK